MKVWNYILTDYINRTNKLHSYLVSEKFDDRYFNVVNALDGAQQIYFRNNNLV